MLQLRTILNTKMNKKGFTLAELLVVVAIIAILVAVSIPIFSGKLQEARENTDLANVRAAKAAAVTEYLSNESFGGTDKTGYYDAKNGVINDVKTNLAGYNEFKDNGGGKTKAYIVEVKIVDTNPAKPTVETKWVSPTV
ncbi:MAG: prepilin-type N-terminal cleavage/methylation domain-containing protein [Anaerovoracaceae bacterium]